MNLELFATTGAERDLFAFETRARRRGFKLIAGIDEAGRGPLAGPVVAAAVILPHGLEIPGLDDSKKLTPQKRETLIEEINAKALAVAVGVADHSMIDRINILQATLVAMMQAVSNLQLPPDFLLIDGISNIQANIPQQTVKKGDSLSASIAAASIVAKVTRDRMMDGFDRQYPGYGFAGHKGYGSAAHFAAIAQLGPCEIHRKSFRGVREHLDHEPEEDAE
ncbi:ribonuclease HII [Geobacter sp. OR-1]|uniref:ribonuclease HII n=1 Tax=Geobacter sp. OR-1 TaxID=1266765 RepID=UPI00054299E6|nr:ribonuclease HII [Geobacter sp. OR-1]GAM11430.1 ribonuclease HII [Geobacter sp. OR-1]